MKTNAELSFEDFDYEKAKASLPEGYEPLPYIRFDNPKAEKLIKVIGYSSEIAAQRRVQELQRQYPSDQYQIVPNQVQVSVKDYALIIPESAQKYLGVSESVVTDNPPLVSLTNYMPFLYRFFDKEKYETSFFEKGELLLSTIARCKTVEAKERQDTHENQNIIVIKDGKNTTEIVMGFDLETLLLCTSLSRINKKEDGSVYEFGFKINNTEAFFDVLTRALVSKGINICEVVRGPCVYNDKLITLDATGLGLTESFLEKSKHGELDFAPIMQYIGAQARHHMLMNKPTIFSEENEYRHVWILSQPIRREDVTDDVIVNPDGSIIVRVPELIAYCQRL